ncbi:GIY-YIG nuclease family protein [Caenispirillum bisanense]|uniref:T5orf172 domain-containing protein n=1 Tax=Caenispirillum bisanense TaxID=414052 RepID=A0A286GNV4_9PROT|nr:GIY-YIG nuclease family protein [Caenispirillum bisanense]SOD97225.1 T5orf172 domain-containing protein [Caenispirillum bisanense]
MANDFTDEDDALLAELGIEVEQKKQSARTPREERIIAGFEDIQKFIVEHGRLPRPDGSDIFERIYAVRLERLRNLPEATALLADLDHGHILTGAAPADDTAEMDDDALLAALGVEVEASPLTDLKHVRSTADRKAAEDVANRRPCDDFDAFKPLFEKVQRDLETGQRETRPFKLKAEIQKGRFFVVEGQKAYVAEMGEPILTDQGKTDARLRVIFDNGTESNMLLRSLQRALNKDETGRRITEPVAGPLFADAPEEGDGTTGTIYVLRSKSDHPMIAANRELVHKIGVTTLSVEKRIAGAHLQPTFLMAPVEVVATYDLYNINQTRLENLIHRIFGPAQLDIQIPDRFGRPVTPREWFLVPLFVIDAAVERVRDGSITRYRYDPERAELVEEGVE